VATEVYITEAINSFKHVSNKQQVSKQSPENGASFPTNWHKKKQQQQQYYLEHYSKTMKNSKTIKNNLQMPGRHKCYLK